MKPIKEITNEGLVIFEDETTFSPDIIIFATGFLYDFPFLDLNHIQITDGKRVDYLYKQIFYIPNPSLGLFYFILFIFEVYFLFHFIFIYFFFFKKKKHLLDYLGK